MLPYDCCSRFSLLLSLSIWLLPPQGDLDLFKCLLYTFSNKKDELLSETLITIILSIGLLFFCLVPSTAPSRPHLQRGQHGLVSMGWAVSAPDTWKKTYSYPTTVLLVKAQMENKLYKNRGIGPYIACINYNVINC